MICNEEDGNLKKKIKSKIFRYFLKKKKNIKACEKCFDNYYLDENNVC